MLSLVQSVKLAAWFYRTPLDHDESYGAFKHKFTATYTGTHLAERQIREAYDKWRRDRIEQEVIDDVSKRAKSLLWDEFLKSRARRGHIAAIVLVILAVLFPPRYTPVGDMQISMAFQPAFIAQTGRIDSPFLMCEFVAIAIVWWLVQKMFAAETQRAQV